MLKIPGISQEAAVRVLQKIGYEPRRQSGHLVMSDGMTRVTIPSHNPINALTMGSIAKTIGLAPEEFRFLL
jgi:predicted RNA binding protein YcfA (HicA-like mRNA interferase family)